MLTLKIGYGHRTYQNGIYHYSGGLLKFQNKNMWVLWEKFVERTQKTFDSQMPAEINYIAIFDEIKNQAIYTALPTSEELFEIKEMMPIDVDFKAFKNNKNSELIAKIFSNQKQIKNVNAPTIKKVVSDLKKPQTFDVQKVINEYADKFSIANFLQKKQCAELELTALNRLLNKNNQLFEQPFYNNISPEELPEASLFLDIIHNISIVGFDFENQKVLVSCPTDYSGLKDRFLEHYKNWGFCVFRAIFPKPISLSFLKT